MSGGPTGPGVAQNDKSVFWKALYAAFLLFTQFRVHAPYDGIVQDIYTTISLPLQEDFAHFPVFLLETITATRNILRAQ